MKKGFLGIIFFTLLLSAFIVVSHEGEEEDFMLNNSQLYPLTQLEAVGYGSLTFIALVIIILSFNKKMSDNIKKISYFLIAAVAIVVTFYLIITTLNLNIVSVTKGPVHWHADFQILACDNQIHIEKPEGFSNKQGTDLMHAHDDNRIHVEGVLLDKKQASLGAFFHAVGGSMSDDSIKVPTNNGLLSVHDGDICNEKPAKLYVFVNGNLIDNPSDYVISPYEKVPPGDRIKIVFTEKPIEEINPNIKN